MTDLCPICIESFSNENVTKFGIIHCKCSHILHSLCYQDLVNFNLDQICPICRSDLLIDNIIPPMETIESFHNLYTPKTVPKRQMYRRFSDSTLNNNENIINHRSRGDSDSNINISRFSKLKSFFKRIFNHDRIYT